MRGLGSSSQSPQICKSALSVGFSPARPKPAPRMMMRHTCNKYEVREGVPEKSKIERRNTVIANAQQTKKERELGKRVFPQETHIFL